MSFEKFTENQRNFRPIIAVWKRGIFGINKAAIIKYNLDQFSFILLYYDKDNKTIAVQFTNDKNEKGLRKLSFNNNTTILFSAKSFLTYYGIEIKLKEKFLMIPDDQLLNFYILKKN